MPAYRIIAALLLFEIFLFMVITIQNIFKCATNPPSQQAKLFQGAKCCWPLCTWAARQPAWRSIGTVTCGLCYEENGD